MSDVKAKIIACLERCASIGRKTSKLLLKEQVPNSIGNKNDSSSIVQDLETEIQKVEHFELRMPILAPMKAGKSTILNAIIGQNLLPTRNAAMTSIPTEIRLQVTNSEEDTYIEPYLKLDDKFITRMNKLQDDLCKYLKEKAANSDDLKKELERYPHLVDTAEMIRDKSANCPTLDTQISGTERIRLVLTFINDVVRIYECLIHNDAFSNTREFLDVLPRIYAPYIAVGNEKAIHESLGNLVVVDTPGPNEATTSSFLEEIFDTELKKAAVILVVLNYTLLNTKVDNSIAKSIQTIREAKHDDDSLYAIINQVDQRRQGDMTPEQVQEFVARRFNIGNNKSRGSRVFETEAFRALLAKRFLYEVKLHEKNKPNEKFSIEKIPSGKDFITEAYSFAWDGTATCEQLKVMAGKLWIASGFQSFLHEAIENLITKAAPSCLKSALQQCQYKNSLLEANLEVRKKAMAADSVKLRGEINELEKDSKDVKNVMHSQKVTLDTAKKNMSQLIEKHFSQAKADGKKELKQLFDEEFQRNLQQPIGSLEGAIRSFWGIIAQVIGLDTNMTLKFRNEVDANEFVRKIQQRVSVISRKTLSNVRATVNSECDALCNSLNENLKRSTENILKRAQNRLMETFDFAIRKPPFVEKEIEEQENFEYKIRTTYRPWWLLWLIEIPDTEGVQEAASYLVHLGTLERQCKDLLQRNMDAIEKQIQTYVTDILEQKFDRHFEEFQQFLQHYQTSLKQSLEDQHRTEEDKKMFQDKIDVLLQELSENCSETEELARVFKTIT